MKQERLTLTVPEVASMLGISRNLAYQMAREGRIPCVEFGRRLLVPREALAKMLQAVGSDPAAEANQG